jgi:putative endonuclease
MLLDEGWLRLHHGERTQRHAIGVTSDLVKRIWEHRNGLVPGFTKKHGCKLLVWYAAYDDLQEARLRELQMKKWKRIWKLSEIEVNPDWKDLYPTLL